MANLDNPAGRLRDWLDDFQLVPNKGDLLAHAACDLLGVPRDSPEGHAAVMRLGASLIDLCAEVRKETALLPEYFHPELLLADFGQIEKAVNQFSVARSANVAALLSPIDPAGQRCLEWLDTQLHTQRPQPWIPDEVQETLLAQVRSLIVGVTDADDLDDEVKRFLLARLCDVEAALSDVFITGTRGIERATEALVGSARRRPDLWDRVAKTKWARRVGLMAGALCLALQSVGGLPALMPGDDAQPDVTNVQVIIQSFQAEDQPAIGSPDQHGHEDVVDGEIVEDDDASGDVAAPK